MRRIGVALLALAAVGIPPAPAGAWGLDIHRFITGQAIGLLPDAIRPFFERHRAFVVEHSVDPDFWRTAGFEEEAPRHFLDLDAYGPYPFEALPRDYQQAVARHGEATVKKYGTLPWRVAEMQSRLVNAFREVHNRPSPWAVEQVKFFSAVLAHYVADAHVPLHAVVNYDGQLTGQHGVHGRFETELFLRYRDRLRLEPAARPAVRDPSGFLFDTLLDSFKKAAPVLEADRRAIAGGEVYDDAYFDRFFRDVRPILEEQMSKAMAGIAAVIVGAWEEAGRPPLPAEPLRPPAPRKRTP
jgi:hypothetical protein